LGNNKFNGEVLIREDTFSGVVIRVGVDTGGTFSDIVLSIDGEIRIMKLLSTPHNPADAVLGGLQALNATEVDQLTYGSTVATNALLERRGAKVGFVTTKGFEDMLVIGRQARPDIFDLYVSKPKTLAAVSVGVAERVNARGEIEQHCSDWVVPGELLQMDSFAVCLLHSYLEPGNEQAVGARLSKEFPGKHVTLSSEILPEYREYERASTAVVNAYVAPVMSRHLKDLGERLGKARLRVMQSNGGGISAAVAAKEPVRTILSGPAGGVVGAFSISKAYGYDNVITFDMGGTSTDVSLCPGTVMLSNRTEIAGMPMKTPLIDINTVGAGGGSIASLDPAGGLLVGPLSAGAVPGPICYNNGGTDVTITDAHLHLGRMDADHFLGGSMKLHKGLVQEEMGCLALNLGMRSLHTAQGILDVANTKMRRAIMAISVERGFDPRDFALVTFGGAGGLHACDLAMELGIPRVLVPKDPGVLSAYGMLLADVVKNYSASVLGRSNEHPDLLDVLLELKEKGAADLTDEGFKADDVKLIASLDVRYMHQSFELSVPFGIDYKQDFNLAHEMRYGYAMPTAVVEVVTVRLKAVGVTEKIKLKQTKSSSTDATDAIVKTKDVEFSGELLSTLLYDREKLLPGNVIEGPAVIVEYSSTTVIPPGMIAHVNEFKGVEISRQG